MCSLGYELARIKYVSILLGGYTQTKCRELQTNTPNSRKSAKPRDGVLILANLSHDFSCCTEMQILGKTHENDCLAFMDSFVVSWSFHYFGIYS